MTVQKFLYLCTSSPFFKKCYLQEREENRDQSFFGLMHFLGALMWNMTQIMVQISS